MKIEKVQKDDMLTISLEGRLDMLTAPELSKELNENLPKAEKLTLDLKNLEYISSSGLRVLLSAQKEMVKKGGMKLINVNEIVMEVLEVTGFTGFLTIE